MDDFSHLRKAEEESLIDERNTAPRGGEECLRQMKEI